MLGMSSYPTVRIRRAARLAGLAGHTVSSRAKARVRGRRGDTSDVADQRRLAERYASALGDMKGAAMKVGQILSFVDAPWLVAAQDREGFQSALTRLQDDVPPLSSTEIGSVVESELGKRPEAIFSSFSPTPVAAASIGQVHRARLADGAEVAVKIQYPGVADAVRADLANTDMLVGLVRAGVALLGSHAPRLDPRAVVDEVGERVAEELDYRKEAANQEEFARLYADHPFVRIPAVHRNLSSARVLTTDFVQGARWSAAVKASESLRWQWGEVIFRFVFGGLHRHGVFNADPHPGNYLFHDDGTVTFLDFGAVKWFPPARVYAMSRAIDAALDGDAEAVVRSFIDLGILMDDDARSLDSTRLLDFYRHALRDRWDDQPFTETPEFAAEIVSRFYEPFGPWCDITGRLRMPKDLVLLNRINLGVISVLGSLYATADWRSIDDEIRHGRPPMTTLGRAEARWRADHGAL